MRRSIRTAVLLVVAACATIALARNLLAGPDHLQVKHYRVRYYALNKAQTALTALADSGWAVKAVAPVMMRFEPGPEEQALAVILEK